MDTQQNKQLIKEFYEHFTGGDIPALLGMISDDVEWRLPAMLNVPFAGTWRGRAGVSRFLATFTQTQELVEFRVDEVIASGAEVLALGHSVMRVKSTDRLSVSPWAHVWTIADGKIRRFREYVDTAAIVSAHGARASVTRLRSNG